MEPDHLPHETGAGSPGRLAVVPAEARLRQAEGYGEEENHHHVGHQHHAKRGLGQRAPRARVSVSSARVTIGELTVSSRREQQGDKEERSGLEPLEERDPGPDQERRAQQDRSGPPPSEARGSSRMVRYRSRRSPAAAPLRPAAR